MTLQINLSAAKEHIVECFKARLVPMLHGSPGTGKSAIFHEIAKEFKLKVIDLRLGQCDPSDLLGFPRIDPATGKAGYAPMDTFPLEDDPIPDGYTGWLLLFDEITSAPPALQAAAYKVLLDHQVGQHRLHPKVLKAAAGNLETDNAVVEAMSTALQSRMVHFEITTDHKQWVEWAESNGIDFRITGFIKFKPAMLYTFEADHTDKTYASPRTWDFLSRMVVGQPVTNHKLPLVAGTVSEGVAREFIAYCQVYADLPSINLIVSQPEDVGIPREPSLLFAVSGSVANHMTDGNADSLMKFILRMPPEFQVVCLREAIRRNRGLAQHTAIRNWITTAGQELF